MIIDSGEEKRIKILEATLRLISENGFHGTAMSKVATEAGVSTGIIYHYYNSKDELILELYKTLKQKSVKVLMDNLDLNQPLAAQVRSICEHFFKYPIENPQESIFLQQFVTSPYHTIEVETWINHLYQTVIECIEKAQKELIIKDLPLAVIGTLTVDVASSLAQKQAAGTIELTDELIDQILDALWDAIRK